MRKYILLLSIIFLSFAFKSDGIVGWYEVPNNINDQVNDICFLDTLNGYIATLGDNSPVDTGYVMKTTNGGTNWTILLRNPGNIDKIKFFDVNTGYVFGNVGFPKFFKTTDGGSNWQDLSAGVPLYFSADMYFINKDTGWVCSASTISGGIAKTTNGGLNWQLQLGPNPHPKQVFFANASTGWAITNFDVYKTTNGGTNWGLQTNFFDGVLKMFAVTADTVFALGSNTVGRYGIIWKSANGGTNWTRYSVPDTSTTNCTNIYMLNGSTGWLSARTFGRILKTTNGGINWYIQSAPIGTYLTIQFLDTSKGFSAGDKFIKTSDGGGPVTIINNYSEIPQNFKLYQNYPNPFNPNTVISYQLSVTGVVTLKIFDLQGKEVETLVNKKQNAGSYSVEFNASNLPSGAYFYRLETENYSETKKMLLIK